MNTFSSTCGSASFFLRQKIVYKLITFLKKKEQPLKPNYSKDNKMAYASHMLFYGGFIRMQLKLAKEMMTLEEIKEQSFINFINQSILYLKDFSLLIWIGCVEQKLFEIVPAILSFLIDYLPCVSI